MTRAIAKDHSSAGASASWTLKGVDPQARELARSVAHRSGLSVAEWLNAVIAGAGQEAAPDHPIEQHAASNIGVAARRGARPPRVAAGPAKTPGALRKPRRGGDAEEIAGLKAALAEITERLAVAERRSTQIGDDGFAQMRGLEAAIGRVATQTRQNEAHAELQALQAREQFRTLRHRIDRLETQPGTAASVHAQLTRMAARLDGLETAAAQGFEPSIMNAVMSRFMDRIEQGQAHALGSLRALEGALLGLEQVVGGMADAPPPPVVERDAPHLQSAEPAPCLADGRRDITAAVLERLDQPASLEARSVQAIDQIGAEMIRVVQSLDHRVDAVEQRSDDHAAEVGREMSRLVTAMDERLTLAGDAQAGTLQALGGKIALVADQLADNIAASEQRSAQIMAKGLDAVGERLQRAIQQLNLHHDRAAGDLAELVRQREARTAALIAQAYGQVSAAKPDGAEAEPSTAERSGTEPSAAREPGPALHRDLPEQPLQPPVDIAQGETSDARAPEESLVPPPPSVRAAPPRVGAHRELIEQARAAARMNAENLRRPFQKVLTDIVREAPATSSAPPATDDVLVLRSGLGSLLRRRYV